VSGYVAGSRAAARALRTAVYEPLQVEVKPTRWNIATAWMEGTWRWPG
jgi:hypothetical protein